jgi:DNA-binding response OmpR family regulator
VGSILVLDDERDVAELLRDILELEGHRVITATHPGAVEAEINGSSPDLFILDIMLPGESGIQVAQRLRAQRYASTPMIGMSASPSMARAAGRTGLFQEMLTKPFDIAAIVSTVSRYVG